MNHFLNTENKRKKQWMQMFMGVLKYRLILGWIRENNCCPAQ